LDIRYVGPYEGRNTGNHQNSLSVAAKWKKIKRQAIKEMLDCVEEDLRRASITKFRKTSGRQRMTLQRTENSGGSW